MIRRLGINAGTLLLIGAFLGCLRPPALGAQEGPGSWISIGPNPSRGGRVSSVAVDPSNQAHWLIGAGQGGIWETFDSGATLTARTDDQPSLAMGAMAFAPSNPKIVYAGTGEPNVDMSFVGSGLLKSADGGTTWELLTANTFFKGRAISGLAVDPKNEAVLVVTTVPARAGRLQMQALIGETPGIFQSADGGVTWSRKFTGQATSLVVDPGNFSKQYAGVGTLFSPAITPASGNGAYRSFDGGSTWTVVSGPWSSNANSIGRVVLAIAPSDSSVLYVGMEDGIQRHKLLGLWRTDNAWATAPTWVRIPNNSIDDGSGTYGYCGWNHDANSADVRCGYANFLAVQPDRSNVLWAAGRDLWRYDGINWSLIATGQTPALSRNVCCFHGDLHGLVWAGARLIAATDGSVYSTIDEGTTWSAHNGMAITQFYDGALHPSNPSFILGAVQDLAQQVLWTGSNNWAQARTSTHDTHGAIIGSLRPEIDWGVSLSLFGGIPTILRTKDGGISYKPGDGIDWTGLGSYRPQIARCLSNENVVLTGSNRLWKSTNFFNGDTPSFSANSVNMNTEVTTFAFAPSDQSCETYAFGTLTGQLRLTTNGGATWLDINPLRAIPARGVTAIAFDPANTNVLYVALSGFDEETPGSSGHLFKTTAATTQATISSSAWVNISAGNEPHNTIAIDSDLPDVVYVGTDHGVWRSLSAGTSWSRMGPPSGMPNVSVSKLVFSPGTRQLAAFTYGRGAFRLSDTLPPTTAGLQMTPSAFNAATGFEFSQTLTAAGGNPPYTWSLLGGGVLPPGLTLSAAGTISGTPTTPGLFAFTLLVRDASGKVAAARYTVSIASSVSPFSVSNFGGTSATSVDPGSAAASGYARIQPATGSTTPSGVAIFGFRQNETVISEVGVPATPVLSSGRLYAEIGGRVNAGVAIANPNNSTATISFFFTDVIGNQAGSGTMTIPANQQVAQFLDQMPFHVYSTPTFQGTFSFTSNVPIAVIALRGLTNERAEFLMSTLPVIDTTLPAATGPVTAAYFADGGGWSTQVLLVNPTDTAMTGTIQFFSPAGAPVSVTIGGAALNTFTYTIPARGSQKLATSGAGSPISTGSLRVVPGSANGPVPTPLVVFSYKPADVTVSEAGVPVTTGGLLRLYVESSNAGNIESGIAIANFAPTTHTVALFVTDLTGAVVSGAAVATVSLPPGGQTAKFLHDLFPGLPNPFKGVVRIVSMSGLGPTLSVAGLRTRTNERGDFLITTTPPAVELGGTTTSPLFFPQVVIGGGYTTQFILFSGRSNQTSSGSLYFFRSDGTAWPLTLN